MEKSEKFCNKQLYAESKALITGSTLEFRNYLNTIHDLEV